jgi:hypothetical protein
MDERDWKLGDVAWGWPDDVDRMGTGPSCGYRYAPVWQCDGQLGYHVARIYLDEGDEDMASDARLIVAAPALLAALKEVAEECEYRLRKGEDSGDRHTLKLCRAAISKAERKGE